MNCCVCGDHIWSPSVELEGKRICWACVWRIEDQIPAVIERRMQVKRFLDAEQAVAQAEAIIDGRSL